MMADVSQRGAAQSSSVRALRSNGALLMLMPKQGMRRYGSGAFDGEAREQVQRYSE
jgi:hypothetical protein